MKIKNVVKCILLILPLTICGCNHTNVENSDSSEKETFMNRYTVQYRLNSKLIFDEKTLDFYEVSDFKFELDFEKFGINFDDLVAGDVVNIETSSIYFMPLNRKLKNDTQRIEVCSITITKAQVIPLRVSKKGNEVYLIDEDNSSIQYHLIDYLYTFANDETEKKVDCVFHSSTGGSDYTLFNDLQDGEIVYGTYIAKQATNTDCPLYALYSFNPSEK